MLNFSPLVLQYMVILSRDYWFNLHIFNFKVREPIPRNYFHNSIVNPLLFLCGIFKEMVNQNNENLVVLSSLVQSQ